MVAGAVPGDRILATPLADRGRYVEAVVHSITAASAARRVPPCPIQATCGGCPLMAVAEAAQRTAKHRFLVDALARIARLPAQPPVDDVLAAPPGLAYRNRIELAFGRDGAGRRVLGYHRADRPGELVDVPGCAIADGRLRVVLHVAREFFLRGPGSSDPALDDPRETLRLVLRASKARGEVLVALRGAPGPFRSAAEFARTAIAAEPRMVGLVRLVGIPGRRGGAAVEAVWGRDWIAHEIQGIEFRVPAGTFLQVHDSAAELLCRHVLEGAGTPGSVLELYGGIGTHGLALARRGARAMIVDADPAAIACGAEAARRHGILSAMFERADVLSFLRRRGGVRAAPDLVIADPPRTGLGRGVAAPLASLGAPAIAMVSCDPATLARDLSDLADRGYAIRRVTPFDLFPQTAHVEAVAWLSREGAGPG